jgi:hypothetical protein
MYWEDDDRAINTTSYSSTSNIKCVSDYKPVYKIMKELYDEEKESRLINVKFNSNKKETLTKLYTYLISKQPEPVREPVTPVENEECEIEECDESCEEQQESDIVNSVLENKMNNKFCYY